jgi:hypothetical protein
LVTGGSTCREIRASCDVDLADPRSSYPERKQNRERFTPTSTGVST